MPFGVTGKIVKPPHCRPIPIVTVWDAVALLWTIYIMKMKDFEEMELQDQKKYLSRMLVILADKITMMSARKAYRPSAVNVTISAEKGNIKFMFGSSIRTSKKNNRLIAQSRANSIPILQW